LYLATPAFAYKGPLLRLCRFDGQIISSFFTRTEYFGGVGRVIQATRVVADGANGRIFAGLSGGDSVFVFDYAGKQVAMGPVDRAHRLNSLRELLTANGDRATRDNGDWYYYNARFLFNLIAGVDSTALLFTAPYNTRVGTDFLEGGLVQRVSDVRGQIVESEQFQSSFGLMG